MIKQIKIELEKLKRFEKVALNSIAEDDLNYTELKFIVEKAFEAAELIVRLENVLKETKENRRNNDWTNILQLLGNSKRRT